MPKVNYNELKENIQDSIYITIEATGTNNYIATTSLITSLKAKRTKFTLFVANDSTGNCTLNLNSFGAKNIKDANGNIVTKLKQNTPYNLVYNGQDFILQGKGGGGNAQPGDVRQGKKFTNDNGEQVGTATVESWGGISKNELMIHPDRVVSVIERPNTRDISSDVIPGHSSDGGFGSEFVNGLLWIYIDGSTSYKTVAYDENLNLVKRYKGEYITRLKDNTLVTWYRNSDDDYIYVQFDDAIVNTNIKSSSYNLRLINTTNGDMLFEARSSSNNTLILINRNNTEKITRSNKKIENISYYDVLYNRTLYHKDGNTYYSYDLTNDNVTTITQEVYESMKNQYGHTSINKDNRTVIDNHGFTWTVIRYSTGTGSTAYHQLARYQKNGVLVYSEMYQSSRAPQILYYNGYVYLINQQNSFYQNMSVTKMKGYYTFS